MTVEGTVINYDTMLEMRRKKGLSPARVRGSDGEMHEIVGYETEDLDDPNVVLQLLKTINQSVLKQALRLLMGKGVEVQRNDAG